MDPFLVGIEKKPSRKVTAWLKSLRKELGKFPQERIILSSSQKINQDFQFDQGNLRSFGLKPKGLYYAIGDAWLDFIQNDYTSAASNYQNAFRLEIQSENILFIQSPKALKDFHKTYAMKDDLSGLGLSKAGSDFRIIDWKKVAQSYQGIEFSPYFAEHRHLLWYSVWDVPSGCVWDGKAIKEVNAINLKRPKQKFSKKS